MYIEFGQGVVPSPPLAGLMELADKYDGTVAIAAEGVSIYLPFNEDFVVLRDKEAAVIMEFEKLTRTPMVQIERMPCQKVWMPEAAYGMGHQINRLGEVAQPAA